MNPLAVSTGNIAMRKGRKLNDNVVSCYMALSLFLVFTPICIATGSDLTLIFSFSTFDWACLFFIAAGTVFSQTMRFKALKETELTKVQPYTFLQPFQQFLTDFLVFSNPFTSI